MLSEKSEVNKEVYCVRTKLHHVNYCADFT